jgi:antibiotic biosynthesis monooxygenase (ABM) superfamily enzyme
MTDTETPGQPTTPATPAAPPSVHVRALITWLAIFPLVAIGLSVMASFAGDWHPVLRALVLTAIVVPTAVYLVVPRLIALYTKLRAGRS